MTDVLEVLTNARAVVTRGWLQGNWFRTGRDNKVTAACTAGAIRLAANGEQPSILYCNCGCESGKVNIGVTVLAVEAEAALAEVIAEKWPYVSGPSIPEWNDNPGRTKAEVLAVFDEAIKRLTPPPPEPVFDKAAFIPTFGESKVTYTVPAVVATSWVPDTIPDSFVQDVKVLVSTA